MKPSVKKIAGRWQPVIDGEILRGKYGNQNGSGYDSKEGASFALEGILIEAMGRSKAKKTTDEHLAEMNAEANALRRRSGLGERSLPEARIVGEGWSPTNDHIAALSARRDSLRGEQKKTPKRLEQEVRAMTGQPSKPWYKIW